MKKLTKESKVKTRNGYPARIICDDALGKFPIVALIELLGGEQACWYTDEGIDKDDASNFDLVEVSPYDDFRVDDPVMVRDKFHYWYRRHFAGVDRDGIPKVFSRGCTSFTTDRFAGDDEYEIWNECRRPTDEELKGGSNV